MCYKVVTLCEMGFVLWNGEPTLQSGHYPAEWTLSSRVDTMSYEVDTMSLWNVHCPVEWALSCDISIVLWSGHCPAT